MRLLFLLPLLGFAQTTLKPYATVKAEQVSEMSGIVKSRQFRDTYWVHNDSGDKARIFALSAQGRLLGEVQILGAENNDWEDIASDGKSLYISDLGNNGNARKDLAIYVVPEPDPKAASVKATRIRVAYEDQKKFPPEQRHFDCEALFALRGKLFAITKNRVGSFFPGAGANLYRLDTFNTDRVNTLRRVDGASDLGGWVTAADVSPDAKTLAVLVQSPKQSVWLFDTSAQGDKIFSGRKGRQIKLEGLLQAEAICWEDGKTLILTNEQREMFRLKL